MRKFIILILISVVITSFSNQDKIQKIEISNINYEANFPVIETQFTVLNQYNQSIDKLSKDQISVLFNNKEFDFSFTSKSNKTGISYLFLIDVSGSLRRNIRTVKNHTKNIISSISKDDEAAIFAFNDYPIIISGFTSNKSILIAGINKIRIAGRYSRIYNSIYRAGLYLNTRAKNSKRLIVIISDGKNEGSTISFKKTVSMVKNFGISIYSIGYPGTDSRYLGILKQLSSATGGKYAYLRNPLTGTSNSKETIFRVFFRPDNFNFDKNNSVEIRIKSSSIKGQKSFNLPVPRTGSRQSEARGFQNQSQRSEKQNTDIIIIIALILGLLMIFILLVIYLISKKRKKRDAILYKKAFKNVEHNVKHAILQSEPIKREIEISGESNKENIKNVEITKVETRQIASSLEILEVNVDVEYNVE